MNAPKRKATGNNWKPQHRYLVAHFGSAHNIGGDYEEVTGRPGMARRKVPKVRGKALVKAAKRARGGHEGR